MIFYESLSLKLYYLSFEVLVNDNQSLVDTSILLSASWYELQEKLPTVKFPELA